MKKTIIRQITDIVTDEKNRAIEDKYKPIIIKSFEDLLNTDDVNLQAVEELKTIIQKLIERENIMLNVNSTSTLLMAMLNDAKYMTLAHIRWLINLVGLTFKRGNRIILNLKRFNSNINMFCDNTIATLIELAPNRAENNKDIDTEQVQTIINKQLNAV